MTDDETFKIMKGMDEAMAGDIKLPVLPEGFRNHNMSGHDEAVFTDVQMNEYARAAVLADREQRAASAEPVAVIGDQFSIFWEGSGPISPIVERHGLRAGSKLYAAPVELDEMRGDAERLHWLGTTIGDRPALHKVAATLKGTFVTMGADGAMDYYATLRDAIDAARAAGGDA